MKKISSISIVSTLLMILFFLIPMSAKAQNMEYEQFQWSEYHYITPCAKQIANGENRPAICVSFYTQERDCDYIEIYRREGKSGNFKKIAKAKTYEAYYDTAIKVNKTYYYYAIPYWNANEEHGLLTGKKSPVIQSKFLLQRAALVDITTSGNKITLKLPAYDIEDNARMIPMNDAQYMTGFVIYRSGTWQNGYKKIATVPTEQKTYTDTTVKKGGFYFYRIKSYYYDKSEKKYYYGELSESMQIQAGGKNYPKAENVALNIQMVNSTTAKITWKTPKGFTWSDISIYSYDGEGTNKLVKKFTPKKGQTSYALKGLKDVCQYTAEGLLQDPTSYRLTDGTSFSHNRWYSDSVYNGLCPALGLNWQILSCTYDNDTYSAKRTCKLSWNPLANIDGYRIYVRDSRSDDENAWKLIKTIKGSNHSTATITLRSTSEYSEEEVKLEAYRGKKTTDVEKTISIAPAAVTADEVKLTKKNGQIQIRWTDMSKQGVSTYRVYRCSYASDYMPSFGYPTKQVAYLVGETSENTIADDQLTKKGSYTYVIIPVFKNGISAAYAMKNGKTIKF